MRRYFVALVVSILTILTFFRPHTLAQQAAEMGTSPDAQRIDSLDARVQQLNEALNLTDEQKAKTTPLLAAEIKQVQQVRADASLAPREQSAKIREIRQATNQQIRPLLTLEQRQKLDAMRERGRAAGGPGRGEGGQGRLQEWATELNLTDDQKTKIAPILQNEAQQIQQVRADTSLSRREQFAKIREIRHDANQQVRPILTPEQQKKLDDMRQEAREQFRGRGGRGGRNRSMP